MNHLFSGFPRKMVTTMVIVKLPGILTICEIFFCTCTHSLTIFCLVFEKEAG